MSIGGWLQLLYAETLTAAAWVSDAALIVGGLLLGLRILFRWPDWFWIVMAAAAALAARMLAEGRIGIWPPTPPFPFS